MVVKLNSKSMPGEEDVEPLESTQPEPYITVQRDYSVKVILRDGTVVILRDMTADDIITMSSERDKGQNEAEISLSIISELCIKWGDKPGITPIQLKKTSAFDYVRLTEAIASFLPTPKLK